MGALGWYRPTGCRWPEAKCTSLDMQNCETLIHAFICYLKTGIVRMQFCMDFQTICWTNCSLFKVLLSDYCVELPNMTIYRGLLHWNLYTVFLSNNALGLKYLGGWVGEWMSEWDGNSTSVYNGSKHLTSSLTEIEPHTAITNQPDESKEKR